MSLNDRVFASLSKILDECAAATDEIPLQAHCVISITYVRPMEFNYSTGSKPV